MQGVFLHFFFLVSTALHSVEQSKENLGCYSMAMERGAYILHIPEHIYEYNEIG